MADVHPEFSYQVGATPSKTELPRNHCDRMKAFQTTDKPLSLCPPEKDPKWRFFWRLGERPAVRWPLQRCVLALNHVQGTKFAELNADAVTPSAFPQWTDVMNTWGFKMLNCLQVRNSGLSCVTSFNKQWPATEPC